MIISFNFSVNLIISFNFSNPYDVNNCMAPYKGPVEPSIALGGYKKPNSDESVDYKMSNGIILTFLINNYKNQTLLEPALEWELK